MHHKKQTRFILKLKYSGIETVLTVTKIHPKTTALTYMHSILLPSTQLKKFATAAK